VIPFHRIYPAKQVETARLSFVTESRIVEGGTPQRKHQTNQILDPRPINSNRAWSGSERIQGELIGTIKICLGHPAREQRVLPIIKKELSPCGDSR